MNYIWDNIFQRKRTEEGLHKNLQDNMLFQDLTEREVRFLESIVHIRRYHAGEPVFRQGEIGVGMYIIIKGRIEIFVSDAASPNDESRDIFITQLLAKDFFGELALVEENGRRTASAVAREESLLIGFFKPDLVEILSRTPATGTKIVFRLAEVLGRRLKETTEKVSELRGALREMREPPPIDTRTDGT
jgi:CRP/FNR family cyclic AMP-dependent transcriptional regulator